MACGCGKKSNMSRRITFRPAGVTRPVTSGVNTFTAAAVNPTEVRALGMPQSLNIGETRRMDDQRQRLEKLRRAAIKKRLQK